MDTTQQQTQRGSIGGSDVGQASELPLGPRSDLNQSSSKTSLQQQVAPSTQTSQQVRPDTQTPILKQVFFPGSWVSIDVAHAVKVWNVYSARAAEPINPYVGLPIELLYQPIIEPLQPITIEEVVQPEVSIAPVVEKAIQEVVQDSQQQKNEAIPTLYSLPVPELYYLTAGTWNTRFQQGLSQLSHWWNASKAPILKNVGTACIVVSSVSLLFLSSPLLAFELRSFVNTITQPLLSKAGEGSVAGVETSVPKPTPELPPKEEQQFQLIIPKIGVNSKVIANVDVNNAKDYESALKVGIAHARGTGFPDEDGGLTKTIFIFGHSTNAPWNINRYNALFYNLKDMNSGDTMQVWFWGKEFWYKVTDKKIVEPNDVEFLKAQREKEQLVLQTCWPPGTTQKRLLIFAERTQKPATEYGLPAVQEKQGGVKKSSPVVPSPTPISTSNPSPMPKSAISPKISPVSTASAKINRVVDAGNDQLFFLEKIANIEKSDIMSL